MYIEMKIKEIRERKKVSIEQLEISTGISKERISKIEAGEIDPSISEAEKIAQVLEVNIGELYEIVE